MSRTPKPGDLAEVAEEQHLAGRHHAALDALRPYFVARELDPSTAPAFVGTPWTFRASCVRWLWPRPRRICGLPSCWGWRVASRSTTPRWVLLGPKPAKRRN